MKKEQRSVSRIPVSWPLKMLRADKKYVEGTIRNISTQGLNVDMKSNLLQENESVMIETSFFFKNEQHKIRAITKVVFKTIQSGGTGYNLGFKVVEMKESDQVILGKYINYKLSL